MEFNISRYRYMDELSYRCEVITPMFVAGADQETAELREASTKGLLRFWWRATGEFDSLTDMKKKEDKLFGSTESKSLVKIRLMDNNNMKTKTELPKGRKYTVRGKSADILEYLAYGHKKKEKNITITRRYIDSGNTFSIRIIHPSEYKKEIENAFYAFSMFGGIGSKSRNGFGCFKVLDERVGIDKNILEHTVEDFTRVSLKRWEYKTEKTYDDWVTALSIIGLKYRDAKIGFSREERAKIALPIKGYNGRQAKPFFLHVSKTSDGKYRGKINFFPTSSMMDKKNPEEYDNVFRVFIDTIKKTGEMK